MVVLIVFEGVEKAFGAHKVLNGLNFQLAGGEVTFILGKSGEGKSVTIKHIMGLLKPDRGRIIVDGDDISTYSYPQLCVYRQKIGMLFQHAALFDLPVIENIVFPLREHSRLSEKEIRARGAEVVEQLGLQGLEQRDPSTLATGEKKRVGLARALVHRPKILLYDEPTTGMDPLVCDMVDHLITETSRRSPGLCSVVISHDLKAALATADRIIMLYKGKVLLAGLPDDFRTSQDPIIRQFFAGKTEGPMEFI